MAILVDNVWHTLVRHKIVREDEPVTHVSIDIDFDSIVTVTVVKHIELQAFDDVCAVIAESAKKNAQVPAQGENVQSSKTS